MLMPFLLQATFQKRNKSPNQQHDPKSAPNYMKGRFQLATYAKFNRPDPMRDWDWLRPHTLNLYEYVGNDPINMWDPTGLKFRAYSAEYDKKDTNLVLQSAFKEFSKTKTGRQLLKRIHEDQERTVWIGIDSEDINHATRLDEENSTNGVGSDSRINWDGKSLTGLFHELVHGFRMVTGTEQLGVGKEVDPVSGKTYGAPKEEIQATGTGEFENQEGPSDNKYREQSGRDKRNTYTLTPETKKQLEEEKKEEYTKKIIEKK